MATLTLDAAEVGRVAADAARLHENLEVVGVSLEGGSGYAEVLVRIRGCSDEPCLITLGVFRDLSEVELLAEISTRLDEHLRSHRRRQDA